MAYVAVESPSEWHHAEYISDLGFMRCEMIGEDSVNVWCRGEVSARGGLRPYFSPDGRQKSLGRGDP